MNRLRKMGGSTVVWITIIVGVLLSGITANLNYQLINEKAALGFDLASD
jgi:hypothetical protein